MKQTFTKTFNILLLMITCLLAGFDVNAQQYTPSVPAGGTGKQLTGMAIDNAGNIFVIRHSAGANFELVKYPNGDPSAAVVIYNQLGSHAPDYSWGVAVNDNGDVFVTKEDLSGWKILKFDAVTYNMTQMRSGSYYTALAVDNSNNLLTMEFNNHGDADQTNDSYRLMRYAAGLENQAGTQLYDGFAYPTNTPQFTYPWGIAVDGLDNIYVLDRIANGGGRLIKLSPPSYNAPITIASGKGFTSVAVDAQNNVYTLEAIGATTNYQVVKYSAPTSAGQTGTAIAINPATTFTSGTNIYPWGLAVNSAGEIYVNDGFDAGTLGRLVKLTPPPINVTSINRVTTTPSNAATVQFLVSFDGIAAGGSTSNFGATVVSGSITGASVATVTGSGATRTVTVNTGSGNGTIRLDMLNNSGIAPTVNNMPFIIGQTILIDKTAPTGAIAISNGATYATAYGVTLNLTGNDLGGSGGLQMAFSADGTTYSAYEAFATTKSFTLSGLDGTKTVYMRLRDAAGNLTTFQDDIILDRTAPETGIVSGPTDPTNSSNATFDFFSDDPAATFEVQLDPPAGAYAPATDPITFTGLAAGSHTINVRAVDVAGNRDLTPESYTWVIDQTAPSVSSVTVPANGTYGTGQQLDFTVVYNEAVTVDQTGGTPYLSVTIGSTVVHANYVSGSGSANLVFRYTVAAGDLDIDGIAVGGTITPAGGTITDIAGNTANLTLNNIGNTNAVWVDGVGPVVNTVSAPAGGYYNAGDVLSFTVNFNENVTITGTPSIPVVIGATTVQATYASGSGSSAVVFSYTVQAGENDMDGIAVGSDIALNAGGAIRDALNNNATLTLNNVGNTSGVFVNTVIPMVGLSGSFQPNLPWTMTITFSEAVTGFIAANINCSNCTATALSTSDNTVYTVTITPTADGLVSITVPANVAENIGGNGNAVSNTINYTFDGTAPSVTSVNVPADRYYGAGEVLSFTVNFSENVNVTGTPSMPITIGVTTVQATYTGGTGTNALTFAYTVVAGQNDQDGITVGTALATNGGAIRDQSLNSAVLTINGVDPTNNVWVDAVAPTVTSVDVPVNKYYKAGQLLTFTVHTSENVAVTGTPSLEVNIGGATKAAAYVSGSGTNALVFTYTVVAGDNDMDGIALGALNLNGGTLQDPVGNDMVLTLNNVAPTNNVFVNTVIPTVGLSSPTVLNGQWTMTITFSEAVTGFTMGDISATNASLSGLSTSNNIIYTVNVIPQADGTVSLSLPVNSAFNIGTNGNAASNTITYTYDATAPVITSVAVPANGIYTNSDALDFTVHYSENVTVTGIPSFPVTVGATVVQATYTAGSGTNALTFRYSVQNGDYDADGITVGAAIALNSGTIQDVATNNAALTLNSVGNTSAVLVDAVPPAITSVNVPADGYYKAGDVLSFTVDFNENVTVTGTPSVPVTIGATTVQANYIAGSGSTALVFRYTVVPGNNDMDGIAVGSALALNGGTVKDGLGNDAALTLNSAGNTDNVFVNTVIPTVTLSGTPVLNGPWTMTITFSEAVTGFTLGDITAANATLSNLQQINSAVYTVLVTAAADGTVELSVPANVADNVGGNGNAASNTITYTHDGTAPAVVLVNLPANGTYNAGDALNFTLNFNENVTVTGSPVLPIQIGATVVQAVYTGGSGTSALAFSYTVLNGQEDNDGIGVGSPIDFNGGTIKDAAGNNALTGLAGVGSTTGILVDALGPVITSVTVPANGYYNAGDELFFTVQFSEPIVAAGSTATLPVTIGTTTVQATIFSSPTPNSIVFRYVVQTGEVDMDGIATGAAIVPGGLALRDVAGNNASLTLNNVGSTSNVFVLANRPTVNVSGAVNVTQPWTAQITFSHAVTGFTLADITLTNATASNLQTTDNITYTALISPVIEGGVSIEIPSSVAQDAAANQNLPSNRLSYYYDPNPPVITSVEVPANGYYKQGDVLNFAVNWNEAVRNNVFPSSLTLPVMIGGATVQAAYTGGFTTQRITFAYTVQAGQMDLDGIQLGTNLLPTNATERVTDLSGNAANLTLNNVANTSGVFVHTGRPTVTLTSAAAARVNAPFTVTLTFSEAVTQLALADFTLSNATVSSLQTTDNITYTVLVTPTADGAATISLPADVAINVVGNGNTASNSITRTYDATPPAIAAGQSFTVSQYSAAGTVVGTVTASDASGTVQNWAIASDGSGGALQISTAGVISVRNTTLLNALVGTSVTLGVTVSDGLNTSTAVPVTVRVVFVNQPPTLDVINNVTICADVQTHTIQLSGASATEPGQTYTITARSDRDIFDVLSVGAGDVLSYRLKANAPAGRATVTVTIRDNGGTTGGAVDSLRRSFTVTVNALPVISITSDKGATVSKGDLVKLTATGGSTYVWTAADGIVGGQRTPVLEVRPQANTTYEVRAASAAGCTATASFALSIVVDFKVDATNILTPNGDGRNDRWVIRNLDSYTDNEVKIFDRAGRMIYSRRNYSNDWDGTVNGSPLAEGTYYYILTIQNGAKTATGYITIVRDRY